MNGLLIGYVRVSKNDGTQKLDLQKDALKCAGVGEDRIFEDYASGKNDKRPGLQACLKALQPGNTLVVWKLDRLGRSLTDLNHIMNFLNKNGIHLTILTSSFGPIDTLTPNGKLMFNLFSLFAEYERDLIRERVVEGLKSARARGRLGGRPPKVTEPLLRVLSMAMKDKYTCVTDLAKKYNLSKTILYKYIAPNGTIRPKGQEILDRSYQKQTDRFRNLQKSKTSFSAKNFVAK